ncbi:Dabb family protein [Microbacterium schleiferi]|uniref:Dabb family protein n=1 Tax=Microbacterium schleiferi TaxID=69362 RepID=A0A7S8RGD4_9MICO|nr:Dabb family protein [Microbacterium schleiferi]QPE04211.1 Dabb family protein [Microbacterium schleiferi]
MTLRHVVMWTMAAGDATTRAEHAAEVARRLNALVGVVPEIRALSAGANSEYPDVNADVVLIMDVDDLDSLEAYQVHPAHEEVAGYIRSVVASRHAVDFVI